MVCHRFSLFMKYTSVFATLALGLLIPTVLSQTNFESRPIWGTGRGRPPGKTCLDYCQLFPICNHGKCFLDQSSCDVICDCEEGYTGKWCKEPEGKVRQRNNNNTQPVPPIETPWASPAHSAPPGPTKRPLMILGTFRARNGSRKSPPFIFPIISGNPPSNNQPQSNGDIAEGKGTKESNFSSNVRSDAGHTVLPNSTTLTIIRTKLEDMDNVTDIDIESAKSDDLPNTDTSPATSAVEFVHPTDAMPTSTVTLSIIQPAELSSVESMSEQKVCEESCHTGKCLYNNGKYRCVKASAPVIMATVENASMAARGECGKGFKCKHGVCDPEQLRKGRIKCICDKGWIGTLCEHACGLDCGENGMCGHPDKNKTSMVCLCNTGYDGDRCQDLQVLPEFNKDVEDPSVHIYVIGFTIGFVVFFILVVIIITYCLWRRRFVFIMKIVHYFQHYEENDGQIYDAFVSYKSSKEDEHFVLTKLYPKLEMELGFKMCMHFRDFTPGEAIANNIISAIERSRRTIMILSPNYINSEWCRMEYQKAQHEMLKMRHKIIPIVLEDVSKCKTMDKNLKTILSTVTYIEWPGEEDPKKLEKFWKKIELSLPKKRSEHSASHSNESTSTSTSSTSNDMAVSKSYSEDPSSKTILSSISDSVNVNVDYNKSLNDSHDKVRGEKRLKKMKDVLKLKINNNNNRALCREISIESNLSTPASSTPSPGFFGGKDSTPLLSRKLLNSKQINKSCAKSSTWSHRNHNRSRKNSQTQSQSFTEKDHTRPCLDVIPHTPCSVAPESVDLPDVCRTAENYNIVCGKTISSLTENDLADMQKCPTCIFRKDDVDANSTVDSLAEGQDQQQNDLGKPAGLNISLDHIRSIYPTSLYSYDSAGESVDITNISVTSKVITNCSTCALRVNVDNICQERETQFTSDFNPCHTQSSSERETQFTSDFNPCHTQSSSERETQFTSDFNPCHTQSSSERETQFTSDFNPCHTQSSSERETQFTSDFNPGHTQSSSERETQLTSDLNPCHTHSYREGGTVNFIKDMNYEIDEKISNIQPNENPLLNVLQLQDNKCYIPNFHVNNAFRENEENKPIPIPPIRVKKLQRQNSRENL